MPGTTETMNERRQTAATTRRRWLWFVGIYAASLLAFSAIVYLLRWLIL